MANENLKLKPVQCVQKAITDALYIPIALRNKVKKIKQDDSLSNTVRKEKGDNLHESEIPN